LWIQHDSANAQSQGDLEIFRTSVKHTLERHTRENSLGNCVIHCVIHLDLDYYSTYDIEIHRV
jgi:hypothetical protein